MKFLREAKKYSERRATALVDISRSVMRYRKRPDRNAKLRAALRRLAFKHRRAGYRMLFRRLRMDGWEVNHKRVERLYREEKLPLRRKRRRRRSVVVTPMPPAQYLNDCWSIDFMSDALTSGRALRFFTAVDDASRECLDLFSACAIPAKDVTERLDRIGIFRGYPQFIRTDGGPEFQSKHFADWCAKHGIVHITIEPGKPQQNAFIEAFNGLVRNEFLNESLFHSAQDANTKATRWKYEYNFERPHGELAKPLGVPPAVYARRLRELKLNEKTLIQSGAK